MERRGSCLEGCGWDKTMGQVLALGGSIALPMRSTAVAEARGMPIGRAPSSLMRVFALWRPDDSS